jgi:DNA topoisomerase-1
MTPESVTLEDALRLLTLPRTLGESEGEEVVAANGRYGPYVKKGKETRSLENEDELFTITLQEALAKLAEPRTRGRRAAAPPLKELGDDPVSGKPIVLKEGRFGPYVTDGETNASLRAGDSIESITPERARELIQARRERGPAKPVSKRTSKEDVTRSQQFTAGCVHNLNRPAGMGSHPRVEWTVLCRCRTGTVQDAGEKV